MTFPKVMPLGDSEIIQQKLGIAIVGLGDYSTERIIPALHQTNYCGLEAVICGEGHDKKQVADNYHVRREQVMHYDEMETLCNNKAVQLVYIAVPNSLHRKYVLKAAAAGKHILCEKPLAPTVKECAEMVAACKEHGVRLYTSYRLQFSPYHQEISRLGTTRVLGKVKHIKAANGIRLDAGTGWRLDKELAGGGSLLDVGIYLVQACRYVTGEEPVAVKASVQNKRPDVFKEVEDTVHWEMHFPSGAIADCTCSYSATDSFITVEAEKGSFSLNPAFTYEGIQGQVNREAMKFPEVMPEALLLDHVAYSILYKASSPVNGTEGMKDIRIIAAIYRSIASGREERL